MTDRGLQQLIDLVVDVRIEAATEQYAREAARQMGVEINTIKNRGGKWHIYGVRMLSNQRANLSMDLDEVAQARR